MESGVTLADDLNRRLMGMEPSLTPRPDKELLAGCLRGDRDCQEALVRQFSNLVYATLQRGVKAKNAPLSQQSIEDLYQTVFLSLFEKDCRKLRQYKGKNGCSLASWIRMLTSRVLFDHLRRGADVMAPRHQVVALDLVSELNAPEPSAIEQITMAEQRESIESGLKQLNDRDQLVIRMHCIEGRSLPKVAQALGISDKNIHSVKHRAIQRLKILITGRK